MLKLQSLILSPSTPPLPGFPVAALEPDYVTTNETELAAVLKLQYPVNIIAIASHMVPTGR